MKIIGVGRNYVDHAKELNNPVPEHPVIFFKPDTALLRRNEDFFYPAFSNEIHYECEVVFRINREGKYIKQKFVHTYIDGIGLGIDFTARDIQRECKAKGLPWTLAKGFNGSAPVSEFFPPQTFNDFANISFSLEVNGEKRQSGNTKDMLFSIEELVEFISRYMTLKKGDLIFTGTPSGVGPVHKNDQLQAYLEDQKVMDFYVR